MLKHRNPHHNPELSERQQDVASIADVPPDVLPDDVPALLLYGLAYASYGVRCYQSGGPHGTWVVWIDRLAEVRADRNGRVPISEWIHNYRGILRELGYGRQEGGTAC